MNKLELHSIPHWPCIFAKLVSGLAIITGIGSLLSWLVYLWLPPVIANFVFTIKPNVAICFILVGIAIWLSCENRTKLTSIAIEIISAITLLIGFLTLFEYFFNINLGIDELFFKEPKVNTSSILSPGRMPPMTAVNFVLIGLTFFFTENKIVGYRACQVFIISIFIISFFQLLNHIYAVGYLNLFIGHTFPMTLYSACMFILVSLSMLALQPTQGIMSIIISKNHGGRLSRRLIPFVLIFPVLLGYLGLLTKTVGSYELVYGITLIVLTTSLFFAALILGNSYLVDKAEIKRKLSLQKLQQSQTLALKSAGAGTWSWNIPHNVLKLDEQLHTLFGIKVGKFPGYFEAIFNFIHPKDRQRVYEEIIKSVENDYEYESEFRVVYDDSSTHTLAVRGHIYRDIDNQPINMTGICWDVTHRKKIEEELRNAKLQAEKLADKAKEASYAKSAFLTAMSHEIRTPLNGVLGMLELLYDTPLTTDQRAHIETARVSGEELLSVINNILDFSKIESGRMELESMDFNLQTLIDDVVEMHASQVQHKNLALGAIIDPKVPLCLTGDAGRIRQVLSNILNNATKFTDRGEISIRVKLATREDKQVTLLFEVADTGVGIPVEARTKIFKPFSQVDISTSRKYGGTGLGLAISKRLVELMGGSINFKSFPSKGSKFWFTVKVMECEVIPETIKQEITPELKNSRILCVDDNAINREIIKRQIELLGLKCDMATNAGEALSLLKKAVENNAPYDLAIVDCLMPGMDGLEMVQVMRELKEIAETNVIILSSTEAGFGFDQMKHLNILMSLTKPIRQNKLHEAVIAGLQIIHGNQKKNLLPEENLAPQNTHILLAEDNFVNQQVALGVLNKLGYQTHAVKNGAEALEAYKKNQYDLILMDCQMPEMDGYMATEIIRKLEKETDKHIPIIAMTAHALKGDRDKCILAGMDDYVAKPIDIKQLATLLKKWIISAEHKSTNVTSIEKENTEISMAEAKLVDMNRIHEIFGDDNEVIQLFIKNLLDSTESLLSELQPAIVNKDTELTKNLFHRLKGSCGNSGLMEMHKVSLEAEEKVKASDWDAVNQLYDSLKNIFQKVIAEFAVIQGL